MFKYLYKIIVILFLSQNFSIGQSQNLNPNENNDTTYYLKNGLLSLDSVLIIAQRNSPVLKRFQALIKIKELDAKTIKKDWMKYINFQTNVSYGIGESYVLTQATQGQLSTNTSALTQLRYNFGVGLNLPLSQVLQNKHNNEIAKQEIEVVNMDQEIALLEFNQIIIKQYNLVKLNKSLVSISLESINSAQLRVSLGERQFNSGIIKIEELMQLIEAKNKTQVEYEKSKSDFEMNLRILQELVGRNILN